MSETLDDDHPDSTAPKRRPWVKFVVFGVVLVLTAILYLLFGDSLSLDSLATQEDALRSYRQDHPVLVHAIALMIYVVVTGLSLPGAAVLTLVFGWYFGWVSGLILVSFASTAGATVAFLLSRYLLRDSIQSRFGDRLVAFNDNLDREGAFYLFTLRLIPAVPFFVINVVMGLTPMKTGTFWWVSQIGMLAGTAVYVYAGSTFPSLSALAEQGPGGILTPRLLAAFAALGLFPLVARTLIRVLRRKHEN